jgi:hypothetical protein
VVKIPDADTADERANLFKQELPAPEHE